MTRVALVGYGMAGRQIHTPPLREAGLTVTHVVTRNAERAAHAAEDHPGVVVVSSIEELVTLRDDFDLAVVASPSGDHLANARVLIEAGIPLVIDKPMAVNADDALEIVDLAEHEQVPLTVFQNRRYDPEHSTLARVVQEGLVGEAFRFEHRWERWRPVPKDRWRENLASEDGGGILLDLQSHLVDAAVQLFGPIDTVSAVINTLTTTADDDTFLLCRHESGVTSHLSATSLAGAPGPRVRLLGRDAAYVLAALSDEPVTFADLADADGHCGWLWRGDQREPVTRAESSQADFYRAVAAALTAADPQSAMPVDPRDAVHVLAVLDAARTSASDHREVEVITPGQRPD